jgi:probable F420-dependent oxidoreductase
MWGLLPWMVWTELSMSDTTGRLPTESGPMAQPRPFRFGVSAHTAESAAAWRRFCRRVEDQGYATLHLPDHANDQLSPIPALAVAAEATTSLRVGPLVIDNDFRNPVLLAKELATVDLLSGGRLEWGMGAGWLPSDYERTGIPYDQPGVRLRRMKESIRLMQQLFAGDEVTHHGRRYRATGAVGTPAPVQRPHPPLLVGGQGRRLLTFAARRADIVGIGPSLASHPMMGDRRVTMSEAFDQQVGWIAAASAARPAPPERHVMTFPAIVTPDRDGVVAGMARTQGRDPDELLAAPHTLVGSVEQICDTLEERRARWSVSYWSVAATAAEAFAPVVARLAGR